MRIRVNILIMKSLSVIAMMFIAVNSFAATITVDDDGQANYRTIQAAINAAKKGDTIIVGSGTYREALTFKDGITLQGVGAGTTRIEYSGDNSVITAQQITNGKISGFTIAYTGNTNRVPVLLEDSSLIITKNVITNTALSGIAIKGDSNPQIIDNEIRDNKECGIHIYAGGRGTISGNVISGNGSGLAVSENSDPQITGNEIKNSKTDGIFVFSGGRGTVSGNVISGNGYSGIEVSGNSDPQITNNEIRDNKASGIYIYTVSHGTVFGNIISGNGLRGITVSENSDPRISYNTIVNNSSAGIWAYIDAFPTITNNIIVKNVGDGIDVKGYDLGSDGCPKVSFNDVWGNSPIDYRGISKSATDISVDPLFVDFANGNYNLQANSPCRGASDNGGEIGAYGARKPAVPSISLDKTAITFGQVLIDQTKQDKFTITNNGNAYLIVSSITSNHKDYTVDQSSLTIPGDGTKQITVTFKPSTSSSISATLTITSNAEKKTISLSGTGFSKPVTALSIANPTTGQVFPAGTTSTTLTVNIANHTGFWCWKLDGAFPASGPAGGNQVKSGNTATITDLQDGKAYTVYAVLVDVNGNVLSPSVTAKVEFSVAVPPAKTEFVISASKTEVTANAGGSAMYLIKLEGKNGFASNITLYGELPSNITASFDPKKVSLSASEPFTISQLILTIPREAIQGDHSFTVIAIPDSGETKKLTLTLKIGSGTSTAAISISNPTAGQVLTAGTTSTAMNVNISNHTGFWCWKLNDAFPVSGLAGGNQIKSGNTATITGLQDGKAYTVNAALVDVNGNVLSPSVTASVAFSVAVSPVKTEFVVSALKTEVTATAGGFAMYLIKLEGKNGFAGNITLYGELPSNITASFDPKKVALSAAEPLASSQLTLTIPAGVNPGSYSFTVIAIPDSGETKKLTLTLKIESTQVAVTDLMFILQPTEVQFMGKLNLSGQLTASDKSIALGGAVIQLIFTKPGGKTQTFEARADNDGNYQLATPMLPDEVGIWKVKARFDGDARMKASERERTFTVMKGRAEIIFDTGNTGALGTEIVIIGRLDPQLKGQILNLKILRPDGSASTLTGVTTEASGIFRHPLKLDIAGDWEITATWAGNGQYESVSRTHSISISNELGKVIIALGGGDRKDNPDWKRFNDLAEYVYSSFLRRRFNDESIYFLSPEPGATKGAKHATSAAELEIAITQWAVKYVNQQVPLFIYLLSHNLGDQFLLEKHGNQEVYLSPAQLDSWLDKLPESVPVTIIIEACYSGGFINASDGKPTALVGRNRIIIVSARGDEQAMIMQNGSSFSRAFFDRIKANKTIGASFRETEDYMARNPTLRNQFPQMDTDGNGKINTPEDYAEVINRYFPMDMVSLGSPPDINEITPSQTLPKGITSLRIDTKLIGAKVTRVYATIIPPDFDPAKRLSNWSDLQFPEIDLANVPGRDNEYFATYGNFTIPGSYTVIINAENVDGSAIPVQMTVTVPSAVVKGDVNNDGKVNSKDALLVSQFAAGIKAPTDEQKQSADMDSNGIINSRDTILLLRKASESAAPVSLAAQNLLLQNFPNPFNPETWIPYQLKEDGNVTIRIHNTAGELIRELRLGYKPSGMYISPGQAAYWDGRNEAGEYAASGVYFYSIQAGRYGAVRKMIVIR